MNMQMTVNQNMMGMNVSQMNYYNQAPIIQKHIPNVDNILFAADLPDEACEEDLANFFKAYNFSFAKVFHNVMRTHAFVTFNSVEDAQRARLELNGVKISAKYASNKISKPIRLCKYETKQAQGDVDGRTNLLVKNISKEVSAHSLFNMFRQYGDIKSCKLVVDYLGNSKEYGYVSFYRVDDAEKAKNELHDKEFGGKSIKVNYLEHGKRMEKRKNNIYVKHIPKENFRDEDLEKIFSQFGEIKSSVVLKDGNGSSKGFGFVCFGRPEDAEYAFKQMNNTSIWNDLPPLYVNFAMKKSERIEHLQKRREELFKNAQKMTVFTKIKDENVIKNEILFENQIRRYLNTIFGKEYLPKSIKIRFETKNAFITMNSQRDSEEFIRKFQEFSKENQTTLFFSLYKSKVERISVNSYFKKYNNFNQDQQSGKGRYQKYNEFSGNPQNVNELAYPGMYQQQGIKFNNFDEINLTNNQIYANQSRYISYNNFNMNQNVSQHTQQLSPNENIQQTQLPKLDPNDEDSVGEFLYNFVEKLYPDEASKITGMLLEMTSTYRNKLISSRPEDLMKIVHSAYNQLQQK